MRRKIALPILAAAAVLLAAGCHPVVESYEATQAKPSGTVLVSVNLCQDDGSACATWAINGTNYQLLAAFAVPRDAHVQRVFTTGGTDVTLKAHEGFRRSLEQAEPLDDGRRWAAYVSERLPAPDPDADPIWSVTAEIDPAGRAGSPSATLPVWARVDYRHLTTPEDADDPIDCSGTGCEGVWELVDNTAADLDVDFPIRDLSVGGGEGIALDRGTSADVPFTVRYAGATASGDLPTTVSTTIPGATATVGRVAFGSTRTSAVPVSIAVPETAEPGDYEVTLKVGTRSHTLPVHVDAPPVPVQDVTSIGFAETRVGKEQVARNVLVTNSGTRALEMRSSSLSGANAAEFGIVADECAGRSLAPGAGCIVAVHFVPREGGLRSATLLVPTAHGDLEVALSGVGAAIPAHDDVLELLGITDVRTASRQQMRDRGGLVIAQTFLMAGDAAWRLRLDGRRIGRVVKERIAASGEHVVRIPLTKRGLRLLARRRGGRIVLTTALTDVDGRRSVVRRSIGFAQG